MPGKSASLLSRIGKSEAGFTLIEVLVALALVTAGLAAIGVVIATSVRTTRSLEDRLARAGVTETLLSGLDDRAALKPGRSSGESSGYRWSMDVAPLPQSATTDPENIWTPYSITILVRGNGGATRVTTVRLVPRLNG